jgi:hypothetical protein
MVHDKHEQMLVVLSTYINFVSDCVKDHSYCQCEETWSHKSLLSTVSSMVAFCMLRGGSNTSIIHYRLQNVPMITILNFFIKTTFV